MTRLASWEWQQTKERIKAWMALATLWGLMALGLAYLWVRP